MGILLGALGGAGEALANIGQMGMKDEFAKQEEERQFQRQQQLTQMKAAIEQQSQKNLLDYRQQLADQERTSQVKRIGDAQQGILNQAMVDKANANTTYTDPDTGQDSPVQSVDEIPDEVRAALQPSDKDKMDAYVKAGIATGDISPKEAAALYKNDQNNELKLMIQNIKTDAYRDKVEAMTQIAQDKLEQAKNAMQMNLAIKQMQIAARGEAKDKTPADVATMKFMVENGIAKDPNEAWSKLHSKENSKDPVQQQIQLANVLTNGSSGRIKPDDAWAKAGSMLDDARNKLQNKPADAPMASPANPVAPADKKRKDPLGLFN
jgi:hypothetical protein